MGDFRAVLESKELLPVDQWLLPSSGKSSPSISTVGLHSPSHSLSEFQYDKRRLLSGLRSVSLRRCPASRFLPSDLELLMIWTSPISRSWSA